MKLKKSEENKTEDPYAISQYRFNFTPSSHQGTQYEETSAMQVGNKLQIPVLQQVKVNKESCRCI
jgi:hypothetical protein